MKHLPSAPKPFFHFSWVVVISYLVALGANAVPVPPPWSLLIPPFGLLMLFYWAMEELHTTHFISAVLIGLLYDALYGTLLGLHAALFSLFLFLLLKIRVPLRLTSPIQQALILMLIMLLYQIAVLLFVQPTLRGDEWYYFFAMPLTLLIFWPIIRLGAEKIFGRLYRQYRPKL